MEQEIEALKQQVALLQKQLREQQKLASLGLLSAGIAHEIQNPLNFVINFSKMSSKLVEDLTEVLEDCADKLDEDDAADIEDISADIKDNMQKIQEHGERAISIIRGILLMSRGKDGEFLPTDINTLVHEYVWLSYHAMRANDKSFNISIHEEYQNNMPKMMVIPQDLSRAILNVVNNACYAVKERAASEGADYQPSITIKTSYENETLSIVMNDNGCGMTDEVKAKLFHELFTTKPVGQGTGLGMSITHDLIVNRHNGKIILESTPSVGSTFTFVIPVKVVK
ncbi:MAG: two-component sensor histidine kinase [Prevotellaceae bacterium]|nr:two-component sensor histidine kinase [Candidatus Minthosoma equi]